MSIQVQEIGEAGLEIDIQDIVDGVAYGQFLPKAEQKIGASGLLDLLVRVSGFKGWSAKSLWKALDFDSEKFAYVRRLALVGDEPAAKWLAVMAEPFLESDVRFFAVNDIEEARDWIRAGGTTETSAQRQE